MTGTLVGAAEPDPRPTPQVWLNAGVLTAGCAPYLLPVWFTVNAAAPVQHWDMVNTAAAAPWPTTTVYWTGQTNR